MIAYLKGTIVNKRVSYLIINVNGVGYKVFAQPDYILEKKIDEYIEIYTYQHVKEDILALYGFNSLEDLELFELLLSISGVGPKSALAVLSVATTIDIKHSIISGDPSLLTRVSGIGKKTAERVVLELRDKISKIEGPLPGGIYQEGAGEEMDALVSLGYSYQQAREALQSVDKKVTDSHERIRLALRNIGK